MAGEHTAAGRGSAQPLSQLVIRGLRISAIFAINPFLVILGNILTIQCLLSFGLRKEYSQIYIVSSLIGIVLIVVLTRYFGSQGTALSTVLIESIVAIMSIYKIYKNKINILFLYRKKI
jgi:O-antigen/teichoic acid export membrane protein